MPDIYHEDHSSEWEKSGRVVGLNWLSKKPVFITPYCEPKLEINTNNNNNNNNNNKSNHNSDSRT